MIPEENECKELISNLKLKKVNLKETILASVKSGMVDQDFYVSMNDGFLLSDAFPDLEFCSEEYFNKISNVLNGDDEYYHGVYISLCFVSEEDYSDEDIIRYKVDGLNENEIIPQGISTYKSHVNLLLPSKCLSFNMDDDFGVLITEEGNSICWRGSLGGGRHGMSMMTDLDGFLEEPVHRLCVKMVYEAIVFE